MAATKQTALERPAARDPFARIRQMTSELNRMFEDVGWPGVRWPALRTRPALEAAAWIPQIDVFEKDGRLVTKVDLPGIKKENIKVEVSDGHLIIAGAREAMRHTSKLDVVLLDYSLPDSNDLRFLEEVRRRLPQTAMVVMTAYGTPEMVQGAMDRGAYGVLNKPFNMHDVEALVTGAHQASRYH